VGLTLASLGCNVMFTDLEDVVPLLKTNVASNVPSGRVVPALSHCSTRGDATGGEPAAVSSSYDRDEDWGYVCCRTLQWGVDEPSGFDPPYDLILGSDVVYSESLVPILLKTIHDLASPRYVAT
jgi:protein N-lysine methyltransferase METTL21D